MLRHWMGGASASPAAAAEPGMRSMFRHWMGGAGALAYTPSPVPQIIDSGGGEYIPRRRPALKSDAPDIIPLISLLSLIITWHDD
jgi:hypothetical protein